MMIETESGESGLRAFFDEVCADTPHLRDRLEAHGLLREINLHLPKHLAIHFPEFTGL